MATNIDHLLRQAAVPQCAATTYNIDCSYALFVFPSLVGKINLQFIRFFVLTGHFFGSVFRF
jgi:hypothetical protein